MARCTQRSARVNRRSSSAGAVILAPVRPAHPGIDVVVSPLPVTRLHGRGQLDPVQPLQRLVPVNRGDVEPHRTAVLDGDRTALHGTGRDYVRAAGLVERETLGVGAV